MHARAREARCPSESAPTSTTVGRRQAWPVVVMRVTLLMAGRLEDWPVLVAGASRPTVRDVDELFAAHVCRVTSVTVIILANS